MAKTVSKKAATKKAAPKKIGHFKMELYDNESVEVDVDGPNSDLVAAFASIIASGDQTCRLLMTAFAVVVGDKLEDDKPKKKAAPKKKAPAKKAAKKK